MAAPDPHAHLLQRATAALERIETTSARQAEAFDRQAEAFDRQAEALARLMRRLGRSEQLIVATLGDIDASIQRNVDRLDDMGDAIRANTRAVLSVLDRLGPASA